MKQKRAAPLHCHFHSSNSIRMISNGSLTTLRPLLPLVATRLFLLPPPPLPIIFLALSLEVPHTHRRRRRLRFRLRSSRAAVLTVATAPAPNLTLIRTTTLVTLMTASEAMRRPLRYNRRCRHPPRCAPPLRRHSTPTLLRSSLGPSEGSRRRRHRHRRPLSLPLLLRLRQAHHFAEEGEEETMA